VNQSVMIVSAARTPVGAFNGVFAKTPAHHLGAVVIKEALTRCQIDGSEVDEVILGQVLTAGQGAMNAGIPHNATAFVINQLCGSGLRAIALGMQQIATFDAKIIVAGGQESMSLTPHCVSLRSGSKMGNLEFTDTLLKDGLTDAFLKYHMGITAENIAKQWHISRHMQDEFAILSQKKAAFAQVSGRFKDEIVPVMVKDKPIIEDEYIKHGLTLEVLSKLRPAFDKDGTVTAANASGINDGACAVVLMSEGDCVSRDIKPLARIVSWGTAGVDPAIMGTGPIAASRLALKKAAWSVQDLDLIEANEAFAVQAFVVNQEMGWNPELVNVNGGAIAIGHPIGASGARVLTTLIFELKRRGGGKGLATLCIGGGMGVAVCVEVF
jgi:acetyl-CoA C-acetyltransferase